ncbi:alkane 1-monooxygenase [Paraflavisolibacter sp. H34]|uniref:alkane 1-monooxygenase n=1 Tax=Huijunlia imazamoxiresistens TaxID=3127457 RepID=UPI0030198836
MSSIGKKDFSPKPAAVLFEEDHDHPPYVAGPLKFVFPLLTYVGALISFSSKGWLCFLPLMVTWIIIPAVELFLKPDHANLLPEQEESEKHNPVYDYILYIMVLLQVPALFYFLYSMQDDTLGWVDRAGRILTMGLFCGTSAITVGHELGHRVNRFDKAMANISLITTLYMHYLIEHIKGHHKVVATHDDPSSARYGENLYAFWGRCFVFGYLAAWRISIKECRKNGLSPFHIRNEMLQVHLFQTVLLVVVYLLFGTEVLGYFFLSSTTGILLFESVSYIEHYGLSRKEIAPGKMERIRPAHSWDSEYSLGRILLFNAPRHADHHYMASRKYQILRHHDEAPQMPTGYPGTIMLSLVPPLWFSIMNRRIDEHFAVREAPLEQAAKEA